MKIRRSIAAAAIVLCSTVAWAGQKKEKEVRALTIRSIQVEGAKVRLTSNDGVTLVVPAADLKIVDKRSGGTDSSRGRVQAKGKTGQSDSSHSLSVSALAELTATATGTPSVAKIKYDKDGSVKKVKLRVYESEAAAAQAMAEIEQKELRREVRRAERPRNR